MTEQIAWAAGFYCGEGSAMLNGDRDIRVSIGQKNREALDRFQEAVAVGKVRGPYQTKTCPMFQYQIGGRQNVSYIRDLLWPWLTTEKREQFDRAFAALAAVPAMPQRRNRAARLAAGLDPMPPGRSPESVARYRAKENERRRAARSS